MKSNRIALASLVLTVPVVLTLSGCSAFNEVVYREASSEYADAPALNAEWDGDAPWVPRDATDIRVAQSTRAADATILLSSGLELDPELCAEVPRQSSPTMSVDDAPDVFAMDTVFACGEWTVGQTPTGWLGWTPAHPDETEQSPS
ncbi:hypothetical protein [Marisediminicola sp. LYQ134]|uniref:hypothetical protein n=1 Tax=Marisediminicola sp. LYQ134 TaxID=3391061 RepID=UPI0039837940